MAAVTVTVMVTATDTAHLCATGATVPEVTTTDVNMVVSTAVANPSATTPVMALSINMGPGVAASVDPAKH